MTAVPLDETPVLCILCPPMRAKVSRPGGVTDWDCHERLGAQLTEIVARYAKLSAVPSGGAGVGRRAPGFGSRPPLNIHVAALRDPRTAPAELGDPHAPLNLFLTWANWMRKTRSQDKIPYRREHDDLLILYVEGLYLQSALDWITRQPWVPTFAEQVRVVVSQLRSATGEPNPRPVGWCTNEIDRDSALIPCGYPLFPPKGDDLNIGCGGCGATYEPLDQIRMVQAAKTGCVSCGHSDSQHSNDTETRACNVRWCGCSTYTSPDGQA